MGAWVMFASAFPRGCEPQRNAKKNVTFEAKGQRLFYVHNQNAQTVYLAFINRTGTAHAGWTSKIDADKWSALTLDDRTLTFHCVETKPGSEQRVACRSVIGVCLQNNVQFDKNSQGSYWVAENEDLDLINEKVFARGISAKRVKQGNEGLR